MDNECAEVASREGIAPSVAQSVLTELGYGDMTVPASKFNDDDWYLFNPLTLEIKAQFGASQKFQALSAVKPGLSCERGMRVKCLGLWRLPVKVA
jgi:hypothetical protein